MNSGSDHSSEISDHRVMLDSNLGIERNRILLLGSDRDVQGQSLSAGKDTSGTLTAIG